MGKAKRAWKKKLREYSMRRKRGEDIDPGEYDAFLDEGLRLEDAAPPVRRARPKDYSPPPPKHPKLPDGARRMLNILDP